MLLPELDSLRVFCARKRWRLVIEQPLETLKLIRQHLGLDSIRLCCHWHVFEGVFLETAIICGSADLAGVESLGCLDDVLHDRLTWVVTWSSLVRPLAVRISHGNATTFAAAGCSQSFGTLAFSFLLSAFLMLLSFFLSLFAGALGFFERSGGEFVSAHAALESTASFRLRIGAKQRDGQRTVKMSHWSGQSALTVKCALVNIWSQLCGNVLWDVTYLLSVDVVDTDGVGVVGIARLPANHDDLACTSESRVEADADNSGIKITIVDQLVNAVGSIELG